MAAQMAEEARSFFDHSAPTSAWAVSQLFRFWLLTHCASARSLAMVSAITGRDGLQCQLEGEAGGVLGDRPAERDQLVGVDEGEGAGERVDPAAARARNEGRLTVAICSERTGERR